jgi:hypothetical protein
VALNAVTSVVARVGPDRPTDGRLERHRGRSAPPIAALPSGSLEDDALAPPTVSLEEVRRKPARAAAPVGSRTRGRGRSSARRSLRRHRATRASFWPAPSA